MEFSEQTILVTGATRGIGLAIAVELRKRGARVIGTGTRDTASRMKGNEETQGVEWLDVDLSDGPSLQEFLVKVQELGPIDGLINNAGINRIKSFSDITSEDYETLMDINLKAPYFLCQAIGGQMAKQGSGRILNIASIWSVVTKSQRALYSASKAGLVGMTRGLAVELGPRGVLVNALSPGFVLTDLTRESLSEQEMKDLSAQIPLRRMADPLDIAKTACFLVSEENNYITGQNLVADGGFTIV